MLQIFGPYKTFNVYNMQLNLKNVISYCSCSQIYIYFTILVAINCLVSEWSAWSSPGNLGQSSRSRMVLRHALNGGKECPPLVEHVKRELYWPYLCLK